MNEGPAVRGSLCSCVHVCMRGYGLLGEPCECPLLPPQRPTVTSCFVQGPGCLPRLAGELPLRCPPRRTHRHTNTHTHIQHSMALCDCGYATDAECCASRCAARRGRRQRTLKNHEGPQWRQSSRTGAQIHKHARTLIRLHPPHLPTYSCVLFQKDVVHWKFDTQ